MRGAVRETVTKAVRVDPEWANTIAAEAKLRGLSESKHMMSLIEMGHEVYRCEVEDKPIGEAAG